MLPCIALSSIAINQRLSEAKIPRKEKTRTKVVHKNVSKSCNKIRKSELLSFIYSFDKIRTLKNVFKEK